MVRSRFDSPALPPTAAAPHFVFSVTKAQEAQMQEVPNVAWRWTDHRARGGRNSDIGNPRNITKAAHATLIERYREQYAKLKHRPVDRFGESYSFEVLAADLESCERFGFPLSAPNYKHKTVKPEIAALKEGLSAENAREMYEMLMQVVSDEVLCEKTPQTSRAKTGMRNFFERLGLHDTLNVVTLNYDLSDEEFLPGAIDGFTGADEYQTFDSQLLWRKIDCRVSLTYTGRYGLDCAIPARDLLRKSAIFCRVQLGCRPPETTDLCTQR